MVVIPPDNDQIKPSAIKRSLFFDADAITILVPAYKHLCVNTEAVHRRLASSDNVLLFKLDDFIFKIFIAFLHFGNPFQIMGKKTLAVYTSSIICYKTRFPMSTA